MRSRADSPTKTCTAPGCDHPLRARGLCSTHYNQRHQPDQHAATAFPCAVCGSATVRPHRGDRQPACSVDCRTVLQFGHHADGLGDYDWATDAARRARHAGSPVIDVFTRDEIFERDGWICYLCGEEVNREASPFAPDSATVDHVVPLSKGGHHVASNARTAHLTCNSTKQDNPVAIMAA